MSTNESSPVTARIFAIMLICISVVPLAGCSQDFASVDDVYVPSIAEDRFPIQVVEVPVRMSIPATSGKLPQQDVNRLSAFARATRTDRTSPVSVTYPVGSEKARSVSQQAVKILMHHGVLRSTIHVAGYKGKSDVVSLSFTRKEATTKECGDWTKNLGENSKNEPFPNFGCSLQNNLAAMVANPEDFEQPRSMGPTVAASQMSAMESYNSGRWTVPVEAPDAND